MKKLLFFTALSYSIIGCADDDSNQVDIGPRVRSSAMLHSFNSCEELHAALTSSLIEEMRVELLLKYEKYGKKNGVVMEMDDTSAVPSAAESNQSADSAEGGLVEGVDFSGTNNQEGGVDEADFVKTDGYHIYLINGTKLKILGVPKFGELTKVSELPIESRPFQMLLNNAGNTPEDVENDKLIIFSNVYVHQLPVTHPLRQLVGAQNNMSGSWWYRTSNLTKLTVVDISNRAAPKISNEIFIEGNYKTARRVESTVRMVNFGWMNISGLQYWPELPDIYYKLKYDDPQRKQIYYAAIQNTILNNETIIKNTLLEKFIPRIYERDGDSYLEHKFTEQSCKNFSIPKDGFGRGVTSIMSLDLLQNEFKFDADHIVSNWSTIYASQKVLLVVEPSHNSWWYWRNNNYEEATNIHRFDISTAGSSTYTGSGRVEGLIDDQFCLSEYEGNIRVATTTGRWNRWWLDVAEQEEPENHVYVLAGEQDLDVIGHVDGIGLGERIWSARFVGKEAYIVTFRNIDPLWTIDLSDPNFPQVKGELEVPGVSTYIHPLKDARLLTIGFGGNETGLNWATQLSLFNVSDFSNPTIDDKLSFAPKDVSQGWFYAFSEATYEHKAFQYWEPKKMLAIPLSTYRRNPETRYYEFSSKLQLVSVSAETGLSAYGTIDHSDFFNTEGQRYWWRYRDVRRSIFMGDYIYAISDRGVTAHDLATLTLKASVQLEGTDNTVYWDL